VPAEAVFLLSFAPSAPKLRIDARNFFISDNVYCKYNLQIRGQTPRYLTINTSEIRGLWLIVVTLFLFLSKELPQTPDAKHPRRRHSPQGGIPPVSPPLKGVRGMSPPLKGAGGCFRQRECCLWNTFSRIELYDENYK